MVIQVTERATRTEGTFDVTCPHCRKQFRAELLAAQSARHAGFKCPHCRLFVAYERATEDNPTV
jgi:transposase-like protein